MRAEAAQDALARKPGYAGMRLTADGARLELFTTGDPGQARSDAERQGVLATELTVTPASRAYSTLLAVRDRVREDIPAAVKAGLEPVSWGPDVDTNTVRIAAAGDVAAAAHYYADRFGDAVDVVAVGGIVKTSSRLNDASPWNAGESPRD